MDPVSGPARCMSSASAGGSENGPGRGGGHVNGTLGRTNGLVNGIGRTNGLANGVGRTNGLVNGLGRTNGLTNGGRPRDARSARPLFRSVTRRDFRAAYGIIGGSVAIMLIFSFLLGTQVPAPPPYVFAVDGNFGEWRHVPLNFDPAGAGPPQTDLLSYAVHAEAGQLFVYGKTRRPLFQGPATSSVFVLGVGAMVGLAPGGIAIDAPALTSVLSGPAPVVQLKFRALAADIRVNGGSFDLVGGGPVRALPLPFVVPAGLEATQTVTLDPGNLPAGQFITLRVRGVGAGTP